MKKLIYTFLTLLLFACQPSSKTAYIDINEVYSEIEISKELRQKLSSLEQSYSSQLTAKQAQVGIRKDQVLGLKNPSQAVLQEVFQMQKSADSLQKQLEQQFKDSTLKYNERVKDVVNDLVYEYGIQNHYTYIFSPAMSNAFMYADSTLDITKEIIDYINGQQ